MRAMYATSGGPGVWPARIACGLFVAALVAGCVGGKQPAAPAITPLPVPTPLTAFTPAFPQKIVQLAWFYKPPEDSNLATLAQYFNVFVLTKNDEAARDALKAQGVAAPMLQYFAFDAIQDPGNCTDRPWGNQVAYEAGDFCQISEQHPDWFMLDTAGRRIMHDGNAFMDPGNAGWREFFLQRVRQSQQEQGWDGVFLDNVEASLYKRQTRGMPGPYLDDAGYQAAIEGFLQYLYLNYFQPQRRPLFANVIAIQDQQEAYFRYLRYLDGAMEEGFGVDFYNGFLSDSDWLEQMSRFEQTQRLGKRLILVSNGTRLDAERELYAFASYLLIANGGASFRYSNNRSYEQAWLYDNYFSDLGDPTGQRYFDGKVWRRDFAGGAVTVDLKTHTATITTP
nr:hypothetical protein [Chloroflexota bacterium]